VSVYFNLKTFVAQMYCFCNVLFVCIGRGGSDGQSGVPGLPGFKGDRGEPGISEGGIAGKFHCIVLFLCYFIILFFFKFFLIVLIPIVVIPLAKMTVSFRDGIKTGIKNWKMVD